MAEIEKLDYFVAQLKSFVKLAKVMKESELLKMDTFSKAELTFIADDTLGIIKRLEKRLTEHGV